jgi:hypothetical protein
MSVFQVGSGLSAILRPVAPVAIGVFSRQAFAFAHPALPMLAGYADYDDWLDLQEGRWMGLEFGGADAELVPVTVPALLAWARLSQSEPDEEALDQLADFARAVRAAPRATGLAAITCDDFTNHANRLTESGFAPDYEAWRRGRRARRAELAAAGAQVFDLPLRLEDVFAWCDCLDLPISESSLDLDATLLLELLAAD